MYRRGGMGGGRYSYKIVCMCRPMFKRRDSRLTELIKLKKTGALRAERIVKVVPLELIELTGENGCIQKKWVLLELLELIHAK